MQIELDNKDAENILLFLNRIGFSEYREGADNQDHAYAIKNSLDKLQAALTETE